MFYQIWCKGAFKHVTRESLREELLEIKKKTALSNGAKPAFFKAKSPIFRLTCDELAVSLGLLEKQLMRKEHGDAELKELLLSAARSLTETDSAYNLHNLELFEAIESRQIRKVMSMIRANHNLLYMRNAEGQTALHAAIEAGNEQIIHFLILEQSMLDLPDEKEGNTPLHCAVSLNYPIAVKLLIQRGADPLIVNRQGLNCLQLAQRLGHQELAFFLQGFIAKYKNRFFG